MNNPEIRHHGVVRRGKKIYYNPELYNKQLQVLEGKEFEEIIKEKHHKPSSVTHGFYRGGIIATCLTTDLFAGWDKEEINHFFCNKFLKEIIEKDLDGERIEFAHVRSTGDLNQKEMNQFIEQVQDWLAKEGIEILKPEEYNLSKFRIIKTKKDDK